MLVAGAGAMPAGTRAASFGGCAADALQQP
jgi:hypothetical protein